MRKGLIVTLLAGLAALGACTSDESTDQNVAIDINDADPSDIEAVPTDETSAPAADDLASEEEPDLDESATNAN